MQLKQGDKMLRSCKYCGRVHDEDYVCKRKPIVKKKIDAAVKLRNTADWKNMRDKIKRRDKYLCQVCVRELYNTRRKYNCNDLQVHHVIPINSNHELKLEDSNLITLCSMHHSMCDKGQIPYEEVKRIIDEQENKKERILC